jgi:hypothetical protein
MRSAAGQSGWTAPPSAAARAAGASHHARAEHEMTRPARKAREGERMRGAGGRGWMGGGGGGGDAPLRKSNGAVLPAPSSAIHRNT